MPLAVLQQKLSTFPEAYYDEINFSGDELYMMSRAAGLKCLPVKPEHCIELKTLSYSESLFFLASAKKMASRNHRDFSKCHFF